MKKVLAVLLAAGMVLASAACGSESGGGAAPASTAPSSVSGGETEGGKEEVSMGKAAFICKGYSDPMCLLVMNKFKAYWEENYKDLYTVDYFDGETDADKINQLIETCTANQYDVIIMQQQDSDAPVAAVKAAVEAGVKVVVTVGSINDDGESVYIDSDPKQQGAMIAQYAVDQGKLGEGTKVAILQGPAGQFHSNGRIEAYLEIIEQCKANLVAQEICDWQQDAAQTCVENWLVAYPDLQVILSCSDSMSLGAIEAMKLAGRDDILIFSVDATEEGCLALKDGTLLATISQDVIGYAHGAADFTAGLIKGENVESKILESVLVTRDNADEILMDVHGYTQEQIDQLNK